MFKTFMLVTALWFTLGHAVDQEEFSITVKSGSYGFQTVVTGLAEGASLLDAMNKAKTEGKLTFESSLSEEGEVSVTSINAISPVDLGTHYWQASAVIGQGWEPLVDHIGKGINAASYKWTIAEIETEASTGGCTVTSPGFWLITTAILASLLHWSDNALSTLIYHQLTTFD